MKESANRFREILDKQPCNTADLKQQLVDELGLSYHMVQRYYRGKVKKMNPIALIRIADYLNRKFHNSEKIYSILSFYE